MKIKIKRLDHGLPLPLPSYATPGSAGADLMAAIHSPIPLAPGQRVLVPTGFALEIPAGHEAQIRSRSGLCLNHGIVVLNSPGTIDSDYRGELKVILANHGQETFNIERGMRIAQLVIAPVIQCVWGQEDFLEGTHRGGGFGSTGV